MSSKHLDLFVHFKYYDKNTDLKTLENLCAFIENVDAAVFDARTFAFERYLMCIHKRLLPDRIVCDGS